MWPDGMTGNRRLGFVLELAGVGRLEVDVLARELEVRNLLSTVLRVY